MPKTKPEPGKRQLIKTKKAFELYTSTRSNPSFKGNKTQWYSNEEGPEIGGGQQRTKTHFPGHYSESHHLVRYKTKGRSGTRKIKEGDVYISDGTRLGLGLSQRGKKIRTQQRRIPHKPKAKQPNPRGQGTRKKAAANLGTPLATRTVDYGTGKVHY